MLDRGTSYWCQQLRLWAVSATLNYRCHVPSSILTKPIKSGQSLRTAGLNIQFCSSVAYLSKVSLSLVLLPGPYSKQWLKENGQLKETCCSIKKIQSRGCRQSASLIAGLSTCQLSIEYRVYKGAHNIARSTIGACGINACVWVGLVTCGIRSYDSRVGFNIH